MVICWYPLAHDHDYTDLGGDYFTRCNLDRQRDRLINQLHSLGDRVTLDKVAQVSCGGFSSGGFSSQHRDARWVRSCR